MKINAQNKKDHPASAAIKKLAADWISYYEIVDNPQLNTRAFRAAIESGQHPLSYVYGAVHETIVDRPEEAWLLIGELILKAQSEEILAMIAAGPLEDLLAQYPYEFIERVEESARKDTKFRTCLADVWQNVIPNDVWKRIVGARQSR